MTRKKRPKIKVNREKEMRSEEISKMIDEGGLGADKYYKIKKKPKQSSEDSDLLNEEQEE